MKNVNTHEAKTHLSRILEEVEKGEVYIISRNGEPIAELRKRYPPQRTKTDSVLSRIAVNYDPAEPLSTEEWGEVT